MTNVTLIGGGPESATPDLLENFLSGCSARPIALVMAGDARTAGHFSPTYLDLLGGASRQTSVIALDEGLPELSDFGGLIVAGGPTPIYYRALAEHREHIRDFVRSGLAYVGFSAGAMITGPMALLGGGEVDGAAVCPEEWSEGLSEVTLEPGLELSPWIVDVHTAQAGTLGRAVAIAAAHPEFGVVGIDEGTAMYIHDDRHDVLGRGAAWSVRHSHGSTHVHRITAGNPVEN